MPVFERSFKVKAPLHEVAAFHDDPVSLIAITPPPVHVTIQRFDRPARAGSRVIFRLRVGPFGVTWDGTIAEHVEGQYFRDVQNILGHLLHLVFWGTPIIYFYADERGEALRPLLRWNPMTHVVFSYQQILFQGRFDHWRGLALAGLAALLMFWVGARFFDRLRDTLAEEV